MNHLDESLARLAHAPPPPELEGLRGRVLAQLDAHRPHRAGYGMGVIMFAALGMGVIGARIPSLADPVVAVSPLESANALAPSTLLVGEP
jgi:hypothetical protein